MRLNRIWYPETAWDWTLSTALLPLSCLYELGWRSYIGVYQLGLKRRRSAGIPTLGVGNLEAGGSGKTPLTIALASLIGSGVGKTMAISVSGYGSPASRGATLAKPDVELSPGTHGDEACLIRRKLPFVPLIIGRARVAAAEIAEREGFEALILDDGFQHLPLARTADTIVWDERRKNARCMPAGPLREPESGRRRADAVFCEGATGAFGFRRVFSGLRRLSDDAVLPVGALGGMEVSAACAIARPQRFFEALSGLGAKVDERIELPDHHDLKSLKLDPEKTWIVTEKDAVKLAGSNVPELYALEMSIEFCGEEELVQWLKSKLFA